jgi:hypothetical protein
VPAETQLRFDALELRRQAHLSEASDVDLSRSLEHEVGENRAAPQGERTPTELGRLLGTRNPGLRCEPLELVQVERRWLDIHPVPRRLGREDANAELLPKCVDVSLDELLGCGRRPFSPELVDEARDRDGRVRVQQQNAEKNALLGSTQLNGFAGPVNLERPKDRELDVIAFHDDGATVHRSQPPLHRRSSPSQPRCSSISGAMRRRRRNVLGERGLAAGLGVIVLVAIVSATSGAAGQNATPPQIVVTQAAVAKLSTPARSYVLRLTFSARDASGAVRYRVTVSSRGAFLASRLGRTESGSASLRIRLRVPDGGRRLRVVIRASDPIGNETSVVREMPLSGTDVDTTRQRRST